MSGAGDDDAPTYLAPGYSVATVDAALDDRIAKGRELLAKIDVHVFPQPGRADELRADYRSWFNYNATYLERAFTSKELRTEFEGVFIGGVYGGGESDLDRVRELAHDLQRDIGKLVDIKGRLALYEPPAQQGAPSAPLTGTQGRSQPVSVIFQGQVGQVNFSEVIQHAEARIKQVDQRGEKGLADGLQHFTDAIKAAGVVAEDQREDALDAVAVLAEVGALPAEERGKMRGRVRGALLVINDVVKLAPGIKQAWDAWGPTITEHLPHLPPN